jgi:peptidoglycan/xylan/chitin deacetylase (PgdA/CDA1 family)
MYDLTIVMYHYVRPIKNSRFSGLKGLELESFQRQLDYLESELNIVSTEHVIDAVKRNVKLPPNACWLTFDDGYKDHYEYVAGELLSRNLSGAFFPAATPIKNQVMLDVNSIHHILSEADNVETLVDELDLECLSHGIRPYEIRSYKEQYQVANRFDNAETIYFKRMLQHVLPIELRTNITAAFFQKYIGISQAEFSSHLYMSIDELKELVDMGMYVGSHGSQHFWLDKISAEHQLKDIKMSLEFLEEIGAPTTDWIMCYPFGGFNGETLSLVDRLGAAIGITTKAGKANLNVDNPLALPRFDTNDFPQ